jgi:hypothetical protein
MHDSMSLRTTNPHLLHFTAPSFLKDSDLIAALRAFSDGESGSPQVRGTETVVGHQIVSSAQEYSGLVHEPAGGTASLFFSSSTQC